MQEITTAGNQLNGRAPSAAVALGTAGAGRFATSLARLRARLRYRHERIVEDALRRERRRIAADVHDLILQDLAFALATARALADDPASADQASVIVAAGERALAGARQIMGDMRAREREPVVEAVEVSVRTAARDTPLSFDAGGVPAGVQPDPPTLDALVHIGREAVANAVKHAAPTAVEVVLERADEWRLQVRDDGHGCDVFGPGFGLESITRHAHALGGTLHVASAPRVGTTVEAILP